MSSDVSGILAGDASLNGYALIFPETLAGGHGLLSALGFRQNS
jgi:hypothetical protein